MMADRGLEYAWIAITCLNPYAFLYMNVKLYRETLEMFKRVNVQYGPMATEFFRRNNNKVSGFKAPNMFPILLMNKAVSSGWNRQKENDIYLGADKQNRVEDQTIFVADSVYEYDAYPLFLDNYGIQITVFFAIIVLILIFENINAVFFRGSPYPGDTKASRLFQSIRIFLRWNLLLASIIGSFQSLMFYIMVQIEAMASKPHGYAHNPLNFWFAIAALIVLGVLFPIGMIIRISSVYRQGKLAASIYDSNKHFYGIFFMINKLSHVRSLTFVFVLMIRATIFAVLTLLLSEHPVRQAAAMLALSILFAIYLVVLRPFSRIMFTIYQLGNELILIVYLSVLLYLGYQEEHYQADFRKGEITGFILVAMWFLVPIFGIVFGLLGVAMRFAGKSTQDEIKLFARAATLASGQREEGTKGISDPVAEVSQGKGSLAPFNQGRDFVRTPNAVAIDIIPDSEEEEDHAAEAQNEITEKKLERSLNSLNRSDPNYSKNVVSLGAYIDPIFEDAEREVTQTDPSIEEDSKKERWDSNQSIHSNKRSPVNRSLERSRGREVAQRSSRAQIYVDSRRGGSQNIRVTKPEDISPNVLPGENRALSLNISKLREFKEGRVAADARRTSRNQLSTGEPNADFIKSFQSQKNRGPKEYDLSSDDIKCEQPQTDRQGVNMSVSRSRYMDDEGFKKFKERFAFDDA